MSGIKLIHHVNIQISDRERTREWYEKALGAEFLERGPSLNTRQLQLRIGSGEMHFTHITDSTPVSTGHFALEVADWDETLARLDKLGVPYTRIPGGNYMAPRSPDDNDFQGRREDNGEHYTYIYDPDGNMIELVYHPLGLEDSQGNSVELAYDPKGLHWAQLSEPITSP